MSESSVFQRLVEYLKYTVTIQYWVYFIGVFVGHSRYWQSKFQKFQFPRFF
jgi:hypothetical protein